MASVLRPTASGRKGGNVRRAPSDADLGFWHRPALMNLAADLLFLAAGFLLLLAAWSAVQRFAVLPLRQVVITTPVERISSAQIEQAVRTAIAGGFLTVSLDNARAAFETIPWVRRATVRKRWPDTLEVRLEEHRAVAHWTPLEGEARLVNHLGEVFAAESQDPLPHFAGPEGSASRVLERFAEFDAGVGPIGRHVVAVHLSAREAWRLRLDDGVIIDLGRDQDKQAIAQRIVRLAQTYPQLRSQLPVAFNTIDMRYPNGFAVRMESAPVRAAKAQT